MTRVAMYLHVLNGRSGGPFGILVLLYSCKQFYVHVHRQQENECAAFNAHTFPALHLL